MGGAKSGPVRLSFNPQLRVEFRGATVTSDAGLLLPRELDERLGLSALIEQHLTDPRLMLPAPHPPRRPGLPISPLMGFTICRRS
jgi:Transposase DDE domain group 1